MGGGKYAHRHAHWWPPGLTSLCSEEHIAKHPDQEDSEESDNTRKCPCWLWTSTMTRTKETAQFIEHNAFEHTWDNGEQGEWVQFRPIPDAIWMNCMRAFVTAWSKRKFKKSIQKNFPDDNKTNSPQYPRGTSRREWTNRMCPAKPISDISLILLFILYHIIRWIVYGCDIETQTLGPRNGTD